MKFKTIEDFSYEKLERNARKEVDNQKQTVDPFLAAQVVKQYLLPMFSKRRRENHAISSEKSKRGLSQKGISLAVISSILFLLIKFSKVIILSPVAKSKTIYEELQLSDIIYQELENEKGKIKYQN